MMIHSFRLSNILYPWKVVSNVGMVILRPGETQGKRKGKSQGGDGHGSSIVWAAR